MRNAFFITCLFVFLQVWAGAMLGTALIKLLKGQVSFVLIRSLLIGVVVAFGPFLITVPTWFILNLPVIPMVEAFIVILAIGVPMFVPVKYREAAFGPRTYWIWLGLALIPSAVYVLFQKYDMAQAVGVTMLLASAYALWHGVKIRTLHSHALPDEEDKIKEKGDS